MTGVGQEFKIQTNKQPEVTRQESQDHEKSHTRATAQGKSLTQERPEEAFRGDCAKFRGSGTASLQRPKFLRAQLRMRLQQQIQISTTEGCELPKPKTSAKA